MREIKFRGMDHNNKWFYFDLFGVNWTHRNNLTDVCQYTGIKDKNGVEIYEGDIFKAIDDESLHDIWRVEFIDACFKGTRKYRYELDLHYWTESQIEIIGNIYQNPELLK